MRSRGIRASYVPTPRANAYDPYDVATNGQARNHVPASGDTRAWQELSAPIFEKLRGGPMTLKQIRDWAFNDARPRIAKLLAEECLFWLHLQKHVVVEAVGGKQKWRIA